MLLCLSPPSGACVEGRDQSIRCQIAGLILRSLLHFIFFLRQGLLLNLELPVSTAQGAPGILLSPRLLLALGATDTSLGFYLSAEASDSGPHACIVGILPYALDQLSSPLPLF